MSPFSKSIILDNNCISNFFHAGSLRQILTFWPAGTFKIPQHVLHEASNWREHGQEVCQIIRELVDGDVIEIINIDDNSDEEVNAYVQLRLAAPVLGEGESESIAIAVGRDYVVATDDRVATERCKEAFPSIKVITTAGILNMAKADGLLTEAQINEMWKLIKAKRAKH